MNSVVSLSYYISISNELFECKLSTGIKYILKLTAFVALFDND